MEYFNTEVNITNLLMGFVSPQYCYSKIKNYRDLFFRGYFIVDKDIIIAKNKFSSDTYINLIPISRYRKYTFLKKIFIRLSVNNPNKNESIQLTLRLFGVDINNDSFLINDNLIKLVNQDGYLSFDIEIDFDKIPEKTMYIYWEFELEEDKELIFYPNLSGVFYDNDVVTNSVDLKIITPTYKRESYILTNINRFIKSGLKQSNNIELIIIDNGKTLKNYLNQANLMNNGVKIIENINSGGSGGFARGLIEVLEKYPETTHLLFMDDDIDLEPFVIERLFSLLKILKPNIGIGGSMLNLSMPYIMWESSAYYLSDKNKISLHLNKHNIDLRRRENLLLILEEVAWTHFAWWFFVVPVETIKNLGMPMPFFFRGDDMEYGLRLIKNNFDMIDFPSIFVIHEDFTSKHNAFTDYLISRNELILRCIHFDMDLKTEITHLIRRIIKFTFSYRYETAKYVIKGYEDFLKGPEFLKSIDVEKYHENLASKVLNDKAQKVKSKYIKSFLFANNDKQYLAKHFKRWLHIFTFGSHLLPYNRNGNRLNQIENDYIIIDLHSYDFDKFFNKNKILFYNKYYENGYFVTKDIKQFLQIMNMTARCVINMISNYKRVRDLYRRDYHVLSSLKFWKAYLKLDEN
ncbi:MAG: glycosyltransferase family 2 protein [Hydrogenobaculum sp.]